MRMILSRNAVTCVLFCLATGCASLDRGPIETRQLDEVSAPPNLISSETATTDFESTDFDLISFEAAEPPEPIPSDTAEQLQAVDADTSLSFGT